MDNSPSLIEGAGLAIQELAEESPVETTTSSVLSSTAVEPRLKQERLMSPASSELMQAKAGQRMTESYYPFQGRHLFSSGSPSPTVNLKAKR